MLQPEEQSILTPLADPVAVTAAAGSSTLNATARPELVNIIKEDTALESQYLPFPSGINQATNTTITPNQQRPIPSLTLPPAPVPISIPAGQIINYCPKHSAISVTLDGKQLWDQFYRVGTEMIVNRAGRRMFPGFSVSINGLKPKSKYVMKLEILLADPHRFKFINSRWLPVGTAEPQSQYETYVHPDSPNTGTFWTRHGVSFKKLKITNNKDTPNSNAVLHSMHKYFLRLFIEEVKKVSPAGGTPNENGEREGAGVRKEDKRQGVNQQMVSKSIMSIEFPETTFVAVTAYQNEEVTQLKITHNPFAKAFRDNSLDMKFDATQSLYSGNSSSYFSPATVTQPGSCSYAMSPSPSPWANYSPGLMSPYPIPPSFYSISPQSMGGTMTHFNHPLPPTPHPLPPTPQGDGSAFQWPQHNGSDMLHSPAPILPPPPPFFSNYYNHFAPAPGHYPHSVTDETSQSGNDIPATPLQDFGKAYTQS